MFTFANPLLLWMLPLLALPWIFRRRQEERIRHIDFPLVRFLRESEDKELINPQLQELLLLILRTILIAMLIFALAGPKWMRDGKNQSGFLSYLPFGRTLQHYLIVMDSSYSMGYGQDGNSWWRKAEQTWEKVNKELYGFSSQTIRWDQSLTTSNRTPQLSYLSAVERDALFSISPEEEGASVLQLFDAIDQSSTGMENIILITDGQRYPWSDLLDGVIEKESAPSMLVVTIGEGPITNTWCEISGISSPPWGIAGWETITGNAGAIMQEPLDNGTISILRTGSDDTLYSRSIAYPDIKQTPVKIPFQFTTRFSLLRESQQDIKQNPEINLVLRAEPLDQLPIDNQLEIQLPAISKFKVGIVSGNTENDSVSAILTSAINPLQGAQESPPVTIQNMILPDISYDAELDMVVLADNLAQEQLAPNNADQTMEYIKNGGSVVLFTGSGNETNGPWNLLLNSIGWQWLNQDNSDIKTESISISKSGRLAETFSTWDKTMWLDWMPNRHGRIKADGAHPLITYKSGDETAYLVSQSTIGKGRVWVINTSLLPESNALLSPILPPILWEIGKEIARTKTNSQLKHYGARAESDLTLLTNEEQQQITEQYGIRFADSSTIDKEIDSFYGGVDLRLLLIFLCIAIALLESWLSNHLASL
jgi:aerotolerance regulator-like protein